MPRQLNQHPRRWHRPTTRHTPIPPLQPQRSHTPRRQRQQRIPRRHHPGKGHPYRRQRNLPLHRRNTGPHKPNPRPPIQPTRSPPDVPQPHHPRTPMLRRLQPQPTPLHPQLPRPTPPRRRHRLAPQVPRHHAHPRHHPLPCPTRGHPVPTPPSQQPHRGQHNRTRHPPPLHPANHKQPPARSTTARDNHPPWDKLAHRASGPQHPAAPTAGHHNRPAIRPRRPTPDSANAKASHRAACTKGDACRRCRTTGAAPGVPNPAHPRPVINADFRVVPRPQLGVDHLPRAPGPNGDSSASLISADLPPFPGHYSALITNAAARTAVPSRPPAVEAAATRTDMTANPTARTYGVTHRLQNVSRPPRVGRQMNASHSPLSTPAWPAFTHACRAML